MSIAESKPSQPQAERREEAVNNPAATFDNPMQVVQTPQLPTEQKKKALDTWEQDERALQRAAEEGMTGGPPPKLSEVKKAKRELRVKTRRK